MDIQLKPHALTALCAPHAARDESALLIAELALRGPVAVLDCGNRFAGYLLAQHLRLRLPNPTPALRRVFVRRAFTCYQVETLLGETPARPQPTVLLDLLATFQDENVPLPESRRLLEACLRQVERLCSLGPVLASLNPSAASAERLCLLERVCARAQFLHVLELPPPPTPQPALF